LHPARLRERAQRRFGRRGLERRQLVERGGNGREMMNAVRRAQMLLDRRRVVVDLIREEDPSLIDEIAEPLDARLQELENTGKPRVPIAEELVSPETRRLEQRLDATR